MRVDRFLRQAGYEPGPTTPAFFVTLGDAKYLEAVMQMAYALQRQGHKNTVLMICMDAQCVTQSEDRGLLAYPYMTHRSVADVKVCNMLAEHRLDAKGDL